MDYSFLKKTVENAKKDIEVYKMQIEELKKERLLETNEEKKESCSSSISYLEHIINEEEKLIKSIETGEIYQNN